jgi:hypothetical protein
MCQYMFRLALHEPAVNKEEYGGAQERRVSL